MRNPMFAYLVLGLGLVPLSLSAQDDMYFIPKKKTQKTKVEEQPDKKATEQERTYRFELQEKNRSLGYSFEPIGESHMGEERDVDEYNRRYRSEDTASQGDYQQRRTSDYEEEDSEYELEDEWRNGYDGSDEDYRYARRILVFRSPSVGIPVSSRLYWDLCYGPDAIYWNVYDDGFYAVALPTVWNRLYYSPWRVGFWYDRPYWSWYGHSYWDWHYPYYGPCYPHWHRPYYYGWGHRRPHPVYRTNRPSLGRTGVVHRGESGRPLRGTGVSGTSLRPGTIGRGGRVSGRPVGDSSGRVTLDRNGRVNSGGRRGSVSRGARTSSSGERVTVPSRNSDRSNRRERINRSERPSRSQSSYSRPSYERSTPMRSGGSFGGGSRGGGVSRGGGSRGAR